VDAPLTQALQEKVGDELCHVSVLLGIGLSRVVVGEAKRKTPEPF
jgi:hypothetical protein